MVVDKLVDLHHLLLISILFHDLHPFHPDPIFLFVAVSKLDTRQTILIMITWPLAQDKVIPFECKHLFSVTQNHREAPFSEQAGQLEKI